MAYILENARSMGPQDSLDPLELAWAAGFFDGEGSTILHRQASRPRCVRLEVVVSQKGSRDAPPEALLRFQRALGGIGRLGAANDRLMYQWVTRGRNEAFLAIALMWPDLGRVKRAQANGAIRRFLHHSEREAVAIRAERGPLLVDAILAATPARADADDRARAWAAGFLDAEGFFGIVGAVRRARGPSWLRIRSSATQRGDAGGPPEVLERLRRTLGGRVEGHGEPETYKWVIEGAGVRRVLDVLGDRLGPIKRRQAENACARFESQPRRKGDAARCVRGHPYSRMMMKGGRLRKICDACDRLNERRRRARRGIAPRPFKNAARRYTE